MFSVVLADWLSKARARDFEEKRMRVFNGILSTLLFVSLFLGAANAQSPDLILSHGSATTGAGGTITAAVTLDNNTVADELQGWSFGVCIDPTLISIDALALGTTSLTANNGGEIDFQQLNSEADGWAMGAVLCFTACATLPPATDYELAVATYTVSAPVASVVDLCFCNTVGVPPVNTVIVVSGQSIPPTTNCGSVTVSSLTDFVRSDANGDGFTDLSDGIWLLNFLFQGGPIIDCDEANDANADGTIDTADPIYIINYYFVGGSAPESPFPNCGTAIGQTVESCAVSPSCP